MADSDTDGTRQETGFREPALTDVNRRRLLRRGLGAAPVLLTLVSRPVLGGGTSACSYAP